MNKIIVACGTGIATSTYVIQKLNEFLDKNNLKATVVQCNYNEVEGAIEENTKLILSSSNIGKEINGVPVLVAIPYISGLDVEGFEAKISELLR